MIYEPKIVNPYFMGKLFPHSPEEPIETNLLNVRYHLLLIF